MLASRLALLYCFLSLANCDVKAQYADENPAAESWYSQPDGINWLLQHYRPIYDFRPNETVASIGAGQAIREIVYSLMADSLTFYVQDINPFWLEPNRLAKTVRAIYTQAGRTECLATFVPVRGTEKETRLPKQFFNKIIVENSLHEFTYPNDVLQSIRTNLKTNGQLFIWEETAPKLNRKHSGCGKPMFTDESLLKLLDANGFHFIDKTVVDPPRGKDSVFRFQPK